MHFPACSLPLPGQEVIVPIDGMVADALDDVAEPCLKLDAVEAPGASQRAHSQEEMTAQGFRAMAANLLNEMGIWNPDAIEKQLAHLDTSMVRRAYTRGEYCDERVRMMQHWSDYLDQLRDGAKILRPQFGRGRDRGAKGSRRLRLLRRLSAWRE